ncbi:MAG: class I SAM-dependent methyltransferase, partial [Chrysiogenales bacterium]
PLGGYIEAGESVIDIGSGTGSMALELAGTASWVTGIDLSAEMAHFAERRRLAMGIHNAEFIHGSATQLSRHVSRSYDYAFLSLMLHSVSSERRDSIMDSARAVAAKFIIIDYIAPMESKRAELIITAIERFAGGDHWRGYRHWMDNGALDGFAEKQGLTCIRSDMMVSGFSKIAVYSY